jgi:hypothetical protein
LPATRYKGKRISCFSTGHDQKRSTCDISGTISQDRALVQAIELCPIVDAAEHVGQVQQTHFVLDNLLIGVH